MLVDGTVSPVEDLPFPLFRRGKVRDVYDLGDRLLLLATDRLSAFDVVLPTPIAGKGAILTAISNFWFEESADLMPNHRTGQTVDSLGLSGDLTDRIADRSTIAWKADRVNVECVVRGHIAGSGWKEYTARGTLAELPLPTGVHRGDQLPEPRFTPAAKNDTGHDENISVARLRDIVGREMADRLERESLRLYDVARIRAKAAGFALADTKFEFGLVDGELTLIDELLTPDSSRYWDIATWEPGTEPPSYDKQVVRNWLEVSGWDKQPPGPVLPNHIVEIAQQRYADVLTRLKASGEAES